MSKKKNVVNVGVRIQVSQPKSKTYSVNVQISDSPTVLFLLPGLEMAMEMCGPIGESIYMELRDAKEIAKFRFPDRMSVQIVKTKAASWETVDALVIGAIKKALNASEVEVFNLTNS